MIEGVSIANGISWSKDDKTMYFTDSPTKNIFAYDFDAETGQISNRRVFFHVDDESGVPDGHAQDVEGCLWVAIHGCGKVVRVNTAGKITAEISLPTLGVTVSIRASPARNMTGWLMESLVSWIRWRGSLHNKFRGRRPRKQPRVCEITR